MTLLTRLLTDETGAMAIETAIVAPMLLVLSLGGEVTDARVYLWNAFSRGCVLTLAAFLVARVRDDRETIRRAHRAVDRASPERNRTR